MTGEALGPALAGDGAEGVFAAVATAGTTNLGIVDDLAGVAEVCQRRDLWMHVDGAYGGAAPGRALRARPVRRRSSAPTASSSTRTSGCSRRSTAARCSTATPQLARARPHPARRLPRRRSPPTTSGTRPTTPCTCPAARAGCRSGSRWRCTAPTPTATRSSRTLAVARAAAEEIRGRARARAADRAGAVGAVLQAHGLGAGRLRPWSADGCSTQGYAFVTPTVHAGEIVTRFAIVNPRTTLTDIKAILDTMR